MANAPPTRLTALHWLIAGIAAIGFAFDIYEILMLPLIVRPALLELTGAQPGSPEFQMWVGRLFYIPAFAGGIFGLLGGYLTDLFGRRRVLTFSILIYAFAAFASGFSTSVEMLLFFRCLVFIGVCVEFVAAVAWLAELFPNPTQREKMLGYTQAFSNASRPPRAPTRRARRVETERRRQSSYLIAWLEMRSRNRSIAPMLAALVVAALYVLHQDFWFWRAVEPLVFGFLPIGLFYHAVYTVISSFALWLLVRLLWPAHLERSPSR